MVIALLHLVAAANDKGQTVLEKLDPERRAAVVMALIGLGILGGLLIAMTMLAGRWARQGRPARSKPLLEKSRTPLGESELPSLPPEVNRGDTLADRPEKDDTMPG